MKNKLKKNIKDNRVAQFLAQRLFDDWVKNNPNLVKSIAKLSDEIDTFELMWGIRFRLEIVEEAKGRELGFGGTELFSDLQKYANKLFTTKKNNKIDWLATAARDGLVLSR